MPIPRSSSRLESADDEKAVLFAMCYAHFVDRFVNSALELERQSVVLLSVCVF